MDSSSPMRALRILVENRHGALLKIVGVFTTRAINITSLHVTPDQDEELSQMTVSFRCDDRRLEQLRKQILKIVDVVDVQDEQIIPAMGNGGYEDGERLLRATR